jgi:hypothetical protein
MDSKDFLKNIEVKMDILTSELAKCDAGIAKSHAEGRLEDIDMFILIREGINQILNTLIKISELRKKIIREKKPDSFDKV